MTTATIDINAAVEGDRDREAALVEWAASFGPVLAEHAARHDADGSWVQPAFDHLRDSGFLALAVPTELGGIGATNREVALVQRELARHCASTALASAMHQHVTAFTAWRYRRGLPGAEATLRRIVDERIVLVSTGGADLTNPRGEALKVEGGYRVTGRKIFCSQSPVGDVLSTMFLFDDPERGSRVLNMAVPLADPGVRVLDTWNTMGMRGTASNDITLEDVFVPDARVLADRPYGVVDPPLQVILTIAMPVVSAVYLGVAEAATDAAIAAVGPRRTDPIVQRQVGLMVNRLRIAGWALDGALTTAGNDPAPSMDTLAAVMAAKREIAAIGIEVCDLAMEIAGGPAFFKGSTIERAYRDVRGLKFHPFKAEEILVHAGRLALGEPADVLTAGSARVGGGVGGGGPPPPPPTPFSAG
jgi:alkylation response protein AidB-like acyl-CoA dehydrogenase